MSIANKQEKAMKSHTLGIVGWFKDCIELHDAPALLELDKILVTRGGAVDRRRLASYGARVWDCGSIRIYTLTLPETHKH